MLSKLSLLFWIFLPVITVYSILLFAPKAESLVVQQPLPTVELSSDIEIAMPFDITVVDASGSPISGAVVLFTLPELHQGISDSDGIARTTFADKSKVEALVYARGYSPSPLTSVENHQQLTLTKKDDTPIVEDPLAAIFPRTVQVITRDKHSLHNTMMLVRSLGDNDGAPFIYFADNAGNFNLNEVPNIDLECRVYPAALPAVPNTLLTKFVIKTGVPQLVINDVATQMVVHEGLNANTLYQLVAGDPVTLLRSDALGNISAGPLPAGVNYSIKLSD
ncbi:MAG: hypothetical protein OSB63_06595 [Planctomycetota bacterium]|nr:hypothetical protein [Planctomycetota bacterium]